MKKVSVIVPAYNSEYTLNRCIESVLGQDYGNVELVIVDDGSTDHSFEIVESYKSKNVIVFNQNNRGACAARNSGINKSTGYYLKFLDSDDFLETGTLSREILVAEQYDDQFIPYGFRKVLKDESEPYENREVLRDQQYVDLINNNLTITLPLHRRSVIESIGFFDESLRFRQELDLHIRLANSGYKFLYHDSCVFTQYIHSSDVRISSRKLDVSREVLNLNSIRKKFNFSCDSEIAAAWSYKYWTLARQFLKESKVEDAKILFKLAIKIAPDRYKDMMPLPYRCAVTALGPKKAELLLKMYGKLRFLA